MLNTTSESLKVGQICIFHHFRFISNWTSWHETSFMTLAPDLDQQYIWWIHFDDKMLTLNWLVILIWQHDMLIWYIYFVLQCCGNGNPYVHVYNLANPMRSVPGQCREVKQRIGASSTRYMLWVHQWHKNIDYGIFLFSLKITAASYRGRHKIYILKYCKFTDQCLRFRNSVISWTHRLKCKQSLLPQGSLCAVST